MEEAKTLESIQEQEVKKVTIKEQKEKPRAGAGINKSLRKNKGFSKLYDHGDRVVKTVTVIQKPTSPTRLDQNAHQYLRQM